MTDRADPAKQARMAGMVDQLLPHIDSFLATTIGERCLFCLIVASQDGNTVVTGNGDPTVALELIKGIAEENEAGTITAHRHGEGGEKPN